MNIDQEKLRELLIRARETGKAYQKAIEAAKTDRDQYWALVGVADKQWTTIWEEAGLGNLRENRMDDD